MKVADRIIPVPKRVTQHREEENIRLGAVKTGWYRVETEGITGQLAEKAVERLCGKLETMYGKRQTMSKRSFLFKVSMAPAPADMPNGDQGYRLHVEKGVAELTGYGEAGLYYAVTSLFQLMEEQEGYLCLPVVTVEDWPTLKTRGHFIETRYGTDLMELEDWKEVVDFMVDHKENQLTVSVYGCWQVQFDGRVSEYVYVPFAGHPGLQTSVIQKYYSVQDERWVHKETLTPMYEKDFLGALMAYGRERGVQVIPMVNSLGHNTLIPRTYPEVSAKDENGQSSFTGYCTSNPKTYELIFDLYDQIIDRYCIPNGIDAFDIGMDEVRDGRAYLAGDVGTLRSPWCKCPACAKKTRGEIIIDHAVKLMSHLKEKGMKTVYMYNDMVVEHKTASNLGNPEDRTAQFCAALKENDLLDVACLDWWSYRQLRETFHFTTTHPELGLRSTLKPWNGYYNWAFHVPAVQNNYHMGRIALEEKAEGFRSYSTWDRSYHRNNQIQADYAWNPEGTGRPQIATARYVRRNFPTAQREANAAFLLLDDLLRWTNEKSSNTSKSSRHEMLMSQMVAYQYTYYRKDRDYPRNFPGEQVPMLRENPEYLEDLKLMRLLLDEAYLLFSQVALTEGCNKELAKRFRYEVEHLRCLCMDWLAVMKMDTLAREYAQTGEEALLEQIWNAARGQCAVRQGHIYDTEAIKEHYLIPGSARNQSIPMQYFADIEEYISKTPVEELKLDFADMRHAASERFHWLR